MVHQMENLKRLLQRYNDTLIPFYQERYEKAFVKKRGYKLFDTKSIEQRKAWEALEGAICERKTLQMKIEEMSK